MIGDGDIRMVLSIIILKERSFDKNTEGLEGFSVIRREFDEFYQTVSSDEKCVSTDESAARISLDNINFTGEDMDQRVIWDILFFLNHSLRSNGAENTIIFIAYGLNFHVRLCLTQVKGDFH